MLARLFQTLTLLLSTSATTAFAAAGDDFTLLEHGWFEARTIYFHTYSCGPTQEVAKLAGRLEQFRETYATLAGTQAVASPPIIVLAFPDHASLKPFLQLYHGQPANLAGFFSRGSDENLIVLSLADTAEGSLQTIFHEYAHLLFRRNEQVWPLWLKEGMADIYSTFEVAGPHTARIGKPPELYLRLLERQPLMSLEKLFAVNHDSPEYNEREMRYLEQAIRLGSQSYLAHYAYAREKFRLTAKAPDAYGRLEKEQASEIEAELEKSLALMPNFGPAHHLLGFVEMLQGEDLGAAEKHLERAIQLEPENPAYLLALAQAELFQRQPAAARQTLELLCRPYVDEQLQAQARRLLESVKGEE